LYCNYKDAIFYIEKGILIGNATNSYLNLGHVHLIEGNSEKAIECYVLSRIAFRNEISFCKDYESDFELISKFKITKEKYNSLLPLVKNTLELGFTSLEHYKALYSQNIITISDACTKSELNELKKSQFPNDFIDWLLLGNHVYEIIGKDSFFTNNENTLMIFNCALAFAEIDFVSTYLYKDNDFLIFAEQIGVGYYVFDLKQNCKVFLLNSNIPYVTDIYNQLSQIKLQKEFIANPDLKYDSNLQLISNLIYIRNYILDNLIISNDFSYKNFTAFLYEKSKLLY
jgi:hypothetical protein